MKILITGMSGLIGSAVATALLADGHEVEGLGRDYADSEVTGGCDVAIHLAGENVATGRWSAKKKGAIEQSRTEGTLRIARLLAKTSPSPRLFICASAIGIYGERGDEMLDESSAPGEESFLVEVGKKWEAATQPTVNAHIRTVNARFGVVLSNKGGALQKMLPPFRMGLGGRMGNGQQFMSWISMDDVIGAFRFMIEHDSITGPVNLVSPNPVPNAEFTRELGAALHRPAICPLPSFAIRLLLGEMGDALLLASTRVLPKKLVDAGYVFCHPDLRTALKKQLADEL